MTPYAVEPLKVLDLFCGAGGSARGFVASGAVVTGVDNDPAILAQYPYRRVQADALEWAEAFGHLYDLVNASPTCWGYSIGTAAVPDREEKYPRLIAATREILQKVGVPYVIENVEGAHRELHNPTTLCWSMFREPGSVLDSDGTPLTMRRHRLFETSFPLTPPRACRHPKGVQVAGAYGGARRDAHEARHVRRGGYVPKDLAVIQDLMSLPGVSERGCFLAVPPEYTRHILSAFNHHTGREGIL